MSDMTSLLGLLLGLVLAGPSPPASPPVTQQGPGFYQELSWSPDGGTLLVSVLEIRDSDPRFPYRIWRLDPDGGEAAPITEGPKDYWTSWSPSGDRIVFAGSDGQGSLDVFTMRADGSDRQRLTKDEASDTQPDWSPDGRQIAFISSREGSGQLWVMRADGSAAKRLLETAHELQNPEWSPGGKHIAYYETDGKGNDWVFVVRADGSEPRRLAKGLWPTWTPDGESLLFGADGGLYRIPQAGGEPTLVVAGDVVAGELSPDGKRLAYIVKEAGKVAVRVANPDGGNPRTLMERPAPAW